MRGIVFGVKLPEFISQSQIKGDYNFSILVLEIITHYENQRQQGCGLILQLVDHDDGGDDENDWDLCISFQEVFFAVSHHGAVK